MHMKLEKYLRDNGLTDEAFAVSVGLSQSQVSRIRRGGSAPSWTAVSAITKATGGDVTANDLLATFEEEKKKREASEATP